MPHDHYISRAHIRQWAIENTVTVLRRRMSEPKLVEVGRLVAAERDLNSPAVEEAYGKIESAFARSLPRLLDVRQSPTDADWTALREYAVLLHDRYPTLRGSSDSKWGLPGGNAMMVPNPANWGSVLGIHDPLGGVAATMDREELKKVRLQLLPILARVLPRRMQIFRCGPMLLGDAGIHALTLHAGNASARSFLTMPLSPDQMVVFSDDEVNDDDVMLLARALTMKIAMESTVVIDTPDGRVINGLVREIWQGQPRPSGDGLPRVIRIFDSPGGIPGGQRAGLGP